MSKPPITTALLPTGFYDVLPPDASTRTRIVSQLLATFDNYGYELVSPPYIEFEESLFTGSGKSLEHQTFRVMDPVSRKMMGVRADITMQIARIAASRLKDEPRPLRLSYSGQVLQVKGTDLYGERQSTQAGIELIGASSIRADTEVALIAVTALAQLGLEDISIDLNAPKLSSHLLKTLPLDDEQKRKLHTAINRKDIAAIRALAGEKSTMFAELVSPYGNVEEAVAHLESLALPPEGKVLCDQLIALVGQLRAANPRLQITIDPLEHRGFEYHTGISFSLFSKQHIGELGRGGRYVIKEHGQETEAVGMTLYVNEIFRLLPSVEKRPRIFLPAGTPLAEAERFHAEGLVTVFGLTDGDPLSEAMRLHCEYYYEDGKQKPVKSPVGGGSVKK